MAQYVHDALSSDLLQRRDRHSFRKHDGSMLRIADSTEIHNSRICSWGLSVGESSCLSDIDCGMQPVTRPGILDEGQEDAGASCGERSWLARSDSD